MRIKYDSNIIGYMSFFKKATGVDAKDCFPVGETLIFVTNPGLAGKAIGKQGSNVKKLKLDLKKDVKILEHSEDPLELTKNFLFPLKATTVEFGDKNGQKIIEIKFGSGRERRLLLNNDKAKLKELKSVIARYHSDITDIFILQ